MAKQTNLSVFIGRFQPPHNAHIETINRALEFSKIVLIIIGSAFKPSDPKNPWSADQRKDMILKCFDTQQQKRLSFRFVSDHPYNELAWVRSVQEAVESVYTTTFGWSDKMDVTLVGHHKDESSYYLDIFPEWRQAEMVNMYGIDSTNIRDIYFRGKDNWRNGETSGMRQISRMVPQAVLNYMNEYMALPWYDSLVEESEFVRTYKLQWSNVPYPPTFVTADAVVVNMGHVLMVTRGARPGKGLLALPGGFVNQYETVKDCALRELVEETRIKVPTAVLKGSIKKEKRYDYPGRSLRGRTITTAFLIELSERTLPKVKGSDDAAAAKWIPLNRFIRQQDRVYEDHYHIVTDLLGLG